MSRRTRLIVLLAVSVVVLLGQLWPEGTPPLARVVNIVFLVAMLLYFCASLRTRTE